MVQIVIPEEKRVCKYNPDWIPLSAGEQSFANDQAENLGFRPAAVPLHPLTSVTKLGKGKTWP